MISRYVLTDFSQAMLSYWECDPLISQFVKMGYMDYGLLDVEHAEELHLRRANVTLTAGCLQAPPFFLWRLCDAGHIVYPSVSFFSNLCCH